MFNGISLSSTPNRRAFSYKVTVAPAGLAVSLANFKAHAKTTANEPDSLLTIYLKSAIDYAERLTRRDFINRTYVTYRDSFPGRYGYDHGVGVYDHPVDFGNAGFEIRKSKLQSVTSVEYLKEGVLTLVDSAIYYVTDETDYSKILTLPNKSWPGDHDDRLQSVKITFVAGFGAADTDMPDWVSDAVLLIATSMLENKGDCADELSESMVPMAAKRILLQNRIENL